MGSSGHVEVAHVSHVLPDGRTLLDDVSFRIGEGITAALVGPNGAGKTTLLRLVAGDIQPQSGTVVSTGGLGVMRQFIGANRNDAAMVRDLLLSVSPPRVQAAAARLDAAELAMMERDDERTQRLEIQPHLRRSLRRDIDDLLPRRILMPLIIAHGFFALAS